MTDRLTLFNKALIYCSENPLASLSEDAQSRRVLDAVWDGGGLRHILEQGLWNVALRTVALRPETGVAPAFGFRNAFQKPADLVRLNAISSDAWLREPLLTYQDEGGYWFADADKIYVSYVSDGPAFGGDLSRWPASLAEAGARWLASVAAHGFNKAETQIERMETAARHAFGVARGQDAMNQPTRFAPSGRWLRARRGGYAPGRDPLGPCV